MFKKLSTITDEEFYAELGRRRSAARTVMSGGTAPTCVCGVCLKCRKREAMRAFRAKKKTKSSTKPKQIKEG